jgi:hypothetical protein
VPGDLARWDLLFTLSFLGPGDEVLVATRFRVEEDPEVHRRAFRRARKERRAADRRHERELRRSGAAGGAAAGPG